MEKFNLLNDFIEGSLDEKQESTLLYELASNDELRFEFKQILAVNSALKNNAPFFNVPPVVESRLFSSLGIDSAAVVSGTVIAHNGFLNFISRNAQIITASIGSAVAAAVVIFSLLGVLGYEKKSPDSSFANSSQNPAKIETANNNLLAENISTDLPQSEKYLVKTNTIKSKRNNDINYSAVNTSDNSLESRDETFNSETLAMDNQEKEITAPKEKPGTSHVYKEITLQVEPVKSVSNKFEFEFKGSQYIMSEKPTISPSEIAPFNNTALSLFYNISGNFAVGAEIRRETFYQNYYGVDEIGQFTRYQQQPNFTSYGLIVRYALPYYGKFSPFAQLTAGGNKGGYTGRFLIGTKYSIYNDLSLSLGLEYSSLFYNYQGAAFSSSKFGINYSIFYNF